MVLLTWGPWQRFRKQGTGAAFPGDGVGRRRGESGGKRRGARELPLGGRGRSGGGRSWALHGEGRTAACLVAGGDVLVGEGGSGRVCELQEAEELPFQGSACAEEGLRRGLHGKLGLGGGDGGWRVVLDAGEAEARLSGVRSREGRGRSFAAKQMSGRRAGQGRGTGVAVADRPWHRGEQWHWQGTWRARVSPAGSGAMQTRGAGAVWSWGAMRGRLGVVCAGVRRRRGRGAGRREVGETVSGSFVIFSKSKNQFCKFNFSPSSWLQMKKC